MERWQQIESLFQEVLQRDPAERDAYLREACHGDTELAHEVASLLANHHETTDFKPWAAVAAAQLIRERMSLQPGQYLGPYRIECFLAAGGMGEVYRATDTRLHREVAIKVSAGAFSERFEREARVIASLNHPNICQLYDVGPNYLVMELVEGPTLADRIRHRALPIDEALAVARQIAEALETAHEKGRVHRDLKPANIKFTREGVVKVLDFGLAKAAEEPTATGDLSDSPTQTISATGAGVVPGTAAYMSPEQARGVAVDKRADVWAFGCVLYEILTHQPAFRGETTSDILAAVLRAPLDWSALPAATPARIRWLLRRCLERDRNKRLRDIGEARIAIDDSEEGVTGMPAPRHNWLPWFAATLAVALAVVGAIGWWRPAPSAPLYPLMLLSVDLGSDAMAGFSTTAALSPDGKRIVFPIHGPDGRQQLATRLLDQAQATLLRGTENGHDAFFSPDGRWLGFFADGKLKRVSVHGGVPVTLCDAVNPRGGSWSEDGNIIAALSQQTVLWRVPASGGTPQRLTQLAGGEVTHRWPQVLPGGQAVLFTASRTNVGQDDATIEVVQKTGATKVLHRGGYYGRYVPSGHLVYIHQGVLFGVRFDAARLQVLGTPTPLVEDIASDSAQGGGQFDFSRIGAFLYLAGKGAKQSWPVVWLDSSGKSRPLLVRPDTYYFPRFSPDGQRLALAASSKGNDIVVYDWQREATTRLTFDGHSYGPVWSPSGQHIAFRSTLSGFSLSWIRSSGAGEPQRLLESPNNLVPYSFSPDGRRLAYQEVSPNNGFDLWTLPLDTSDPDHPKPGKPEPFLRTQFDEQVPVFSPDGRWIAYRSNESGAYEIYVRPFPPGPGGKWQVSTGGGMYAFWSKNVPELFYETTDNRIMVMAYTINGDSFVPGRPRLWSDRQVFYPGASNLDLAPNGKRFAVFAAPDYATQGSVRVTFLVNFFDELRRRLPRE
jgi:serine/threonine-protein kinase